VVEEEAQSVCGSAGLLVKGIPLPQKRVIASPRRERQMLIPRANTVVKAGEVLVAVAEEKERKEREGFAVAKSAT
jgi:Trk K+ transport system NAD-binding subunit